MQNLHILLRNSYSDKLYLFFSDISINIEAFNLNISKSEEDMLIDNQEYRWLFSSDYYMKSLVYLNMFHYLIIFLSILWFLVFMLKWMRKRKLLDVISFINSEEKVKRLMFIKFLTEIIEILKNLLINVLFIFFPMIVFNLFNMHQSKIISNYTVYQQFTIWLSIFFYLVLFIFIQYGIFQRKVPGMYSYLRSFNVQVFDSSSTYNLRHKIFYINQIRYLVYVMIIMSLYHWSGVVSSIMTTLTDFVYFSLFFSQDISSNLFYFVLACEFISFLLVNFFNFAQIIQNNETWENVTLVVLFCLQIAWIVCLLIHFLFFFY